MIVGRFAAATIFICKKTYFNFLNPLVLSNANQRFTIKSILAKAPNLAGAMQNPVADSKSS